MARIKVNILSYLVAVMVFYAVFIANSVVM
jgi:hypothetical protein